MSHPNLSQATALSATGIALVVALLVPGAGRRPSPTAAAASPMAPVAASAVGLWARAVEAGGDHVAPEELAARMLRGDDVLVIDVRPADEFASGFRLPGSVNMDVPRLLGAEGAALLDARPEAEVVLVSNGMTHPAQAWTDLVRRGRAGVRVLEDGLDGFRARVLTPPSLRGAATEESARAASAQFAAARAYFLAAPTDVRAVSPAVPQPAAPATAAEPPDAKAGRFATDPARIESPTVVSTAWVAGRGAGVVLLDTRVPAEQYAAGHLMGARHVPIEMLRTTVAGVPEELKPPEELAQVFGSLGIGDETEVVVYADDKLQDAAHAALALVSAGHRRVAVMEGGISAWKAEGRSVTTEVPVPTAATFTVRPAPGLVRVRIDEVAQAMRDRAVPIVDVRPGDTFRGEKTTEARPGHIPGSVNREFTSDVVRTSGGLFWRPKDEIAAGWGAAGTRPDGPVIVTCRTGHQAALAWFTLRVLLGYADVRWYDGSWKEWASRAELPAETGPGTKGGR